MPIYLSEQKIPDPFVMSEDEVNQIIAAHLTKNGFTNVKFLQGKEQGIDVTGEKDGWMLYVESKGSHANVHPKNLVFDNGQLVSHISRQIYQLMKLVENNPSRKVIFCMANPNIQRIRALADGIRSTLDSLGFLRIWVEQNGNLSIESPDNKIEFINKLLHDDNLYVT